MFEKFDSVRVWHSTLKPSGRVREETLKRPPLDARITDSLIAATALAYEVSCRQARDQLMRIIDNFRSNNTV